MVETGLEADGAAALCEALVPLSAPPSGPLHRLRALLVNANSLGDAGLASLAAALEEGALPSLRELGLGSNYITDEGVAVLVTAGGGAARCARRLRRLNLAFNFLTSEGARALVAAMAIGEEEEQEGGAGQRRQLDFYENELRGKERLELQLAARSLGQGFECIV